MNRLAVQLIAAGFLVDLGGIVYCALQMRHSGADAGAAASHAAHFRIGGYALVAGSLLLVAGQVLMIRNFLKNRQRRNQA